MENNPDEFCLEPQTKNNRQARATNLVIISSNCCKTRPRFLLLHSIISTYIRRQRLDHVLLDISPRERKGDSLIPLFGALEVISIITDVSNFHKNLNK